MSDEEMDDIIREASNQHYPAYDDQAWGKMERLLDKHLPQKKDKRKYFLFLLLFLLIDTGLFFAFFYPKRHTNSSQLEIVALNKKENISNSPLPTLNGQTQIIATNSQKQNAQQSFSTIATANKLTSNQLIALAINNNDTQKKHNIRLSTKAKFKSQVSYADVSDIIEATTQKNNSLSDNVNNNNSNDPNIPNEIIAAKVNKIVTQPSKPPIVEKNDTTNKQVAIIPNSKQKKRMKNNIDNSFAFTISAGPGFSYVGINDPGKTTISYGAGVKYNFAKKFAIRTGFYVTKKVYSANSSDYHPPTGFWTYFPNLQKVDANCKVYEIPLSISYNLGQNKKHNWFAAVGLTSYFMKQEVYDYYSKDSNGQTTFTNSATINNENKNIFSILTLSCGYQYNISNKFSIAAEPYIEVPLNGIGYGKINLNSGGLLFTAIIKPFVHNK